MKINTTKKLAKIGKYTFIFHQLWDHLPSNLKKECTSSQLASILDFTKQQKLKAENELYEELSEKNPE